MLKTIEIKISDMGEITVEASGYKDSSCLQALKEIEAALGKAKEVELKPEGHKIAAFNKVKS